MFKIKNIYLLFSAIILASTLQLSASKNKSINEEKEKEFAKIKKTLEQMELYYNLVDKNNNLAIIYGSKEAISSLKTQYFNLKKKEFEEKFNADLLVELFISTYANANNNVGNPKK